METINTGFWVRVVNGAVVAVWDTPPPIATQSGWREAIEVIPDITPNREYRTDHYFDLDSTPARIVWNKAQMSVDDRKNGLISEANRAFQEVVTAEVRKQTDEYPETQYDAAVVEAARAVFEARRDAIALAVTHEDVDAL
jgi:hypothetical protein